MQYVLLIIIFFNSLSYAKIYTVKKNDSLWQIAVDNKIALSDIQKMNDLTRNTVYIGQKLYIPSQIISYTVKKGDNFNSLTNRYQTEIRYLVTLNNLSDDRLFVGQKLRIPVSSGTLKTQTISSTKLKPITYTVKRGDTLSDIALKYNTTVPKLRELNNKRSSIIATGERLIVGNRELPSMPTASKATYNIRHTVKSGETLGAIAIKYGVSSSDLRKWNNKRNSTIYIGEVITVNPATKITHTVRRGENLSEIAYKYKISSKEIKQWNKKNNDKLYIGEKLVLYTKNTKKPTPASSTSGKQLITYKVRRGDTLDEIAINNKVSRSDILSWNNKRDSNIMIGERLKIYVTKQSTVKSSTKTAPKTSKKAVYSTLSSQGIKSANFSDIPLPINQNEIIKTTVSGRGVNINVMQKIALEAPQDAYVKYAGYINALQNVVILEFSEDRTVVYAGLGKIRVNTGQDISKGDIMGVVGYNSIDDTASFYMELRQEDKVANILHTYKELSIKK